MTATAIETFIANIHRGEYDDFLDMIGDMVKERQRKAVKSLKVGDRVVFTDSVRPKYLAGVECTIEKQNPKNVVVKLDEPVGKFYSTINVPTGIIRKAS